jgi:ribonuclease HI
MIYKLYTDGATSNNGYEDSRGGYAWALIANDNLLKKGSGGESPATNNICELKAMINGCEEAHDWIGPFDVVLVYSDSAYIINCYKQRWYENWQKNGWMNSKKQPVANRTLWEELIPYFCDARFKFEKVKGHNGKIDENSKWNEFVDDLAVEAKNL